MKQTFHTKLLAAALLATTLFSCQKELPVAPTSVSIKAPVAQNISANYYFDWETAVKMPVSASSPLDVYVPWRSQGGTPLDPGIVDDYKRIDGWELVYNTFAPDNFPNAGDHGTMPTVTQQTAGGLYFTLYNRYRGILRYYMYLPPGLFGSSTQLSHGLKVISANGTTSSMLNFEGVDIVDPLNRAAGFSKTNKDGISTTGGWYSMQYQIAYDPAFAATTYPNLGFQWDTYSLSMSQINLDGVEVGTTRGTISTPKPDFDWANAIINGGLAVAEIYTGGLAGTTGFAKYKDAANGGLAGSLTGLLSGVFGGSTPSPQDVDLTTNSSITTKGTSTTSQAYMFNAFMFPGQSTSGTNGVPPLVNYSLGLFNLSDRPTVSVHRDGANNTGSGSSDPGYATYEITSAIQQTLFQSNPNVFNSSPTGASLSNFKVEVVVIDPAYSWTASSAVKEKVGTHTVFTGENTVVLQSSLFHTPAAPTNVAVRVSFYVVPNNGAPRTLVAKTFTANTVAI